jgi:NADH-quinone oxidoreductase subunit C
LPERDPDDDVEPLVVRLRERFGAGPIVIDAGGSASREPRVLTTPRAGAELLRTLRTDPEFAMHRLVDLTAIDRHASEGFEGPRFEVVYTLSGPKPHERLRVHVAVDVDDVIDADVAAESPADTAAGGGGDAEARADARQPGDVTVRAGAPTVDSVVGLWPAAAWLEREVFDLFGIHFRGHPDLRRILLESDFEGAPLRKDYPRQPNLPIPEEETP